MIFFSNFFGFFYVPKITLAFDPLTFLFHHTYVQKIQDYLAATCFLTQTNLIYNVDFFRVLTESKVVSIHGSPSNDMCFARLENSLGTLSQNRINSATLPMIDLTGYALHQPLKTVPVDMYVTDLRVKVPANLHWAKIDKCRFDPNTNILQAKLLFNDLIVTAAVKLMDEDHLKQQGTTIDAVTDRCNMTLRLRQAGLGFVAMPQRVKAGAVGIRTSATFVDPNFISIHAYNCQPVDVQDQRRSSTLNSGYLDGPEGRAPSNEDISQEMEDIFLRGIRSLLTKYMEKQLQPALKDTLMVNMGYTLSYGRKR